MGLLNRLAMTAAKKRANEIEDILAGLMINGVTKDEIEIREYPDRTIIAVRGEAKYEVTLRFSVRDAVFGKT